MKKGFKLLKQASISRSTQKIIYQEGKQIIRMAIGAIMLGGIIKEDWLKDNIFVWCSFAVLAFTLVMIAKFEKDN